MCIPRANHPTHRIRDVLIRQKQSTEAHRPAILVLMPEPRDGAHEDAKLLLHPPAERRGVKRGCHSGYKNGSKSANQRSKIIVVDDHDIPIVVETDATLKSRVWLIQSLVHSPSPTHTLPHTLARPSSSFCRFGSRHRPPVVLRANIRV